MNKLIQILEFELSLESTSSHWSDIGNYFNFSESQLPLYEVAIKNKRLPFQGLITQGSEDKIKTFSNIQKHRSLPFPCPLCRKKRRCFPEQQEGYNSE